MTGIYTLFTDKDHNLTTKEIQTHDQLILLTPWMPQGHICPSSATLTLKSNKIQNTSPTQIHLTVLNKVGNFLFCDIIHWNLSQAKVLNMTLH